VQAVALRATCRSMGRGVALMPGIVLKRFCDDVRVLQLERKWDD